MNIWQALLLGAIQGFTEFLPVSSSGHLVIFQSLFGGGQGDLTFNVFLHFATLLSVMIVFHRDIWLLIKECVAIVKDIFKGQIDFKKPERRFLLMLIIATIPALIVGVGIKLLGWEAVLENVLVVAGMLLVTAILMFGVDRFKDGKYDESNAPLKSAVVVGAMQALAILPGLSRSGSTIFGGLLSGFKKEFAIKFAFLISIPTVLGAGLLEFIDVVKEGQLAIEPLSLAIGFVVATICGILSIKFIKVLISSNKFFIFGIYCLLAAGFAFLVGLGVIG